MKCFLYGDFLSYSNEMPLYPVYLDKYRAMSTFWTERFKHFNTIEHVFDI